jgi:hypothetical protein
VAVIVLFMALKYIPSHVNETTEPVDNLGGILSLALVGSLILTIHFAPAPDARSLAPALSAITVIALLLFVIRQRRAKGPLYDLKIASRRTFWAAAGAGVIVFGSLMGAMFIGQQFLQGILGYSLTSPASSPG